jgi:hypothetical protein
MDSIQSSGTEDPVSRINEEAHAPTANSASSQINEASKFAKADPEEDFKVSAEEEARRMERWAGLALVFKSPLVDGKPQISPKIKPTFQALLQSCFKEAADIAPSEMATNTKIEATLAKIYKLRRFATGVEAEQILEAAYKKRGIKITAKTKTQYTSLVKLVFGKVLPRPTISRYANTLQLARDEKIKSADFIEFVQKYGGTAACARLATERRRATLGTAGAAEAAAAKLVEERMVNALRINLPKECGVGKQGLIELLIKPMADGSYVVLGQRLAAKGAVRSHDEVAKKLASGVVAKRRV